MTEQWQAVVTAEAEVIPAKPVNVTNEKQEKE